MRSRMNWKVLVVGFLITLALVDVCVGNNGTWDKVREKKARIVKKLKKDIRKLKKQEGAVKLVGGENGGHEGNVEILHDGKWGSVCDDEWDYLEANVVCRQLGFDGAIKPTSNGHFGQARRRYWMDNVYCDGSENELSKCRFDGWGASDCEGGEAAGVICAREQQDEEDEGTMKGKPKRKSEKRRIKDIHQQGVAIRLAGGRVHNEGRVEIKLGNSDWGVVCGDSWSLFEAAVVCRQLGLGYASDAIQTNFFGGQKIPMTISGVQCHGDENNLIDCLHDKLLDCPGPIENVASVVCLREMPDLVFDHIELMRTAHLEDRQLYWLQCAMEENCVASQAYKVQKESESWHLETRRLLRFTARILNAGIADFRPSVPKHLWEWHMCHMHYHSMEVFATFDVLDLNGTRLAEGHKASFCLEDNQCLPGVEPRYKCANYGDQGISVNCSDIYKHNIDCQWVDITELPTGEYIFKLCRVVFELVDENWSLLVCSVFLNINHGPYCNATSSTGLQEVFTASYVVHLLNKYESIPGLSLGLKIFDTCNDETTVYKQALQTTVDTECTNHYEMGILLPSEYATTLEPLRNYSVLPISTYNEQNLTRPLINLMVHYLSTRFETIDALLANQDFALNLFLDTTKEAGICVESYGDTLELEESEREAVIAVIGQRNDIRQWIERGEKMQGSRKTWIALPLDGSNVDDLIPSDSYVLRTSPFNPDLLQEISSPDLFVEAASNPVIHSPHLLGIGKAIAELAQLLQDLQKRNCPRGIESCTMPRFNPNSKQEMRNVDVYNALRIVPKSHSIKYIVAMKSQQEMVDMAAYRIEPANSKFRIAPESRVPKMPKLCLKKYAKNCASCANFKMKFGSRGVAKDTLDRGLLKTGNWIPIFLTVVVCGTFACGVIAVFIIYRFIVEDVLDGNPALTIVLILANVFTLQTVLLFCINDDYLGAEHLNSRKILLTSLAFGLDFSVMLTRAFFLLFSKGGVFTAHINGYLQGLMVFFMFCVQLAISIMFFAFSTDDPAVVMRSLFFVALLGYDIFLLIILFMVCFFIFQLPRNYREGKCFFGTSIGLLIVWAIWLTCFILVEPECRDTVVSFGIISTAYLIIIGILIPRTYYMVTHLARGKKFGQRFGSTDLAPDPRINTIVKQSRPFYDYVHSGGGSMTNLQVTSAYPNYYGNSSPNQKYLGQTRSPDTQRIPGYNNYGYHSEMREVNNSYTVPQVCIEDADSRMSPVDRSNANTTYARPKCQRKRKPKDDKDCIETDVYVEGSLSTSRKSHDEIYPARCSSPRLTQTEATICEENEHDEITRITRF